jgi:hypothetical protein
MIVTGADGGDVVRLAGGPQGGRLELSDGDGRPLVILKRGAKGGTVTTYNLRGVPQNLGPMYVYEAAPAAGRRVSPPPQDP